MKRTIALALTLCSLPCLHSAAAGDWPQIRGADRDGSSAETGLARSWTAAGPRLVWKKTTGEGFSGIAVAGGRLYTGAAFGDLEHALCLDAATGEEVWRTPIGKKFTEDFGNGPRSTPTVVGGRVYVASSYGDVHALDAATGKVIWSVDLQKAYGAPVPQRGYSPSPLVDGDLVLVEAGGTEGRWLVALEAATGKLRWSVGDGPAGYSSPIAVTIDGVEQYVFVRRAEPQIISVKPDGSQYWTHQGWPASITMPMFVPPDRIFISASDDGGAVLLKVSDKKGKAVVEEVWRNRLMKNHFNGSVRVGDFIYGFDNGTFKCVSAATGEQRWAHRGLGKGSLLAADGLLLVLSDQGVLVLAEATPDGYVEKGRVQALEGRTWTAPSLAAGNVCMRDHDEIACYDVSAKAAAADAPTAATPGQG